MYLPQSQYTCNSITQLHLCPLFQHSTKATYISEAICFTRSHPRKKVVCFELCFVLLIFCWMFFFLQSNLATTSFSRRFLASTDARARQLSKILRIVRDNITFVISSVGLFKEVENWLTMGIRRWNHCFQLIITKLNLYVLEKLEITHNLF